MILFLSLVVCLVCAQGQEMPVPVDMQASLLPKILSFERSMTQGVRSGGTVGVIYQSHVRSSFVCANEIAEALPRFLKNADGTAPKCILIEYISSSDLARHIADDGISLVYVAPLRSVDIGDLGRFLQSRRLVSYTGVPSYVEEGIVLGVDVVANRPKILVNLPAARAAGAEFSSQLLKLARVIE